MKRCAIIILSAVCALTSFAQGNLVPNGGFEELSGKLKADSKVDVADGWNSLTGTAADIFSAESKEPGMKTPDNLYGREKPYAGSNYAGIVAYSYQGKEPRTYITAEFTKPLEAGKKYCVRFFVSLSDLSKMGVNNVGAHIYENQYNMSDSNEPLLVEANIKHSRNKIIETAVFWEPICGTYIAKGGEKFIAIGNFYADKSTGSSKMKKAPQFKEAQINSAYYFVDEVSVVEQKDAEVCECEKEEFVDVPKVVYRKQEDNMTQNEMAEQVVQTKIEFDSLSAALKPVALGQVRKLADYLKTKSSLTVAIVGHCSDVEMDKVKKNPALATLSQNRAKAVGDELIKAGIDKKRFKLEGVKNSRPFVYASTPDEHRENQAVNIEIITE